MIILYKNIKSLYCIHETNTMIIYMSIKVSHSTLDIFKLQMWWMWQIPLWFWPPQHYLLRFLIHLAYLRHIVVGCSAHSPSPGQDLAWTPGWFRRAPGRWCTGLGSARSCSSVPVPALWSLHWTVPGTYDSCSVWQIKSYPQQPSSYHFTSTVGSCLCLKGKGCQ